MALSIPVSKRWVFLIRVEGMKDLLQNPKICRFEKKKVIMLPLQPVRDFMAKG
jgi:hypothetical protein